MAVSTSSCSLSLVIDSDSDAISPLPGRELRLSLDAKGCRIEDLRVSIISQHVYVQLGHRVRRDSKGYVLRKITRCYWVPEFCDLNKVYCTLALDSTLTVYFPVKRRELTKEVPVQYFPGVFYKLPTNVQLQQTDDDYSCSTFSESNASDG
ncbi:alpha-crystallin B chain-like [Ornithodoros turicata]|uniref:alpha-crystallin B chain-like n=1 Tax=Ornithodoros turicata TaxID=34597 RepID=UPI003139FC03